MGFAILVERSGLKVGQASRGEEIKYSTLKFEYK